MGYFFTFLPQVENFNVSVCISKTLLYFIQWLILYMNFMWNISEARLFAVMHDRKKIQWTQADTRHSDCLKRHFYPEHSQEVWEAVQSPSFKVNKTRVDEALSNVFWPQSWPCFAWEVVLETSWGPPAWICDPLNSIALSSLLFSLFLFWNRWNVKNWGGDVCFILGFFITLLEGRWYFNEVQLTFCWPLWPISSGVSKGNITALLRLTFVLLYD